MDYSGLPPVQQEMVICSIAGAIQYDVPANVIIAVAEQEGGRPGQWVRNTNGTFDVGPLQFNTSYLAELEKWGITAADVAGKGCYPYQLAAWRIKKHLLNDTGDVWQRVANYHSRTPVHNIRYQSLIKPRAAKWGGWLQKRGKTHDVTDTILAAKR